MDKREKRKEEKGEWEDIREAGKKEEQTQREGKRGNGRRQGWRKGGIRGEVIFHICYLESQSLKPPILLHGRKGNRSTAWVCSYVHVPKNNEVGGKQTNKHFHTNHNSASGK